MDTSDYSDLLMRVIKQVICGPNLPWVADYAHRGFYGSHAIGRWQLGILMKDPKSDVTVDYGIIGFFPITAWTWIGCTATLVYIMKLLLQCRNREESVNYLTYKASFVSFNILINILLNFYTSSLSIQLFKESRASIPFSNFAEFSEMLYHGKLRVAADVNSPVHEMFLKVPTQTNKRFRFQPIGSLPNLINSSIDELWYVTKLLNKNYVVLADFMVLKDLEDQLCDAIAITMHDFPYSLKTFVFSDQNHWLRRALDVGVIDTLKVFHDKELDKLRSQQRNATSSLKQKCVSREKVGLKVDQFIGLVRPLTYILGASIALLLTELLVALVKYAIGN